MIEGNFDSLDALIHPSAIFVHMGAILNKEEEINAMKSGWIVPKSVNIQEVSLKREGSTAIVLSKLQLAAEVSGNAVSNLFAVTEVYMETEGDWKLLSLSFTKLLSEDVKIGER
jgi:ketosteroid isomerase-like protein